MNIPRVLKASVITIWVVLIATIAFVDAFTTITRTVPTSPTTRSSSSSSFITPTKLHMATAEEKVAVSVSGEQLELMLQEWDQPLIVDAYATWYVILVRY
jgi:hypothetical protein